MPDGYGTLQGAVGLQDWNRTTVCDDGATFSIQQGGEVVWASGIVGGYQDALPFGPVAVRTGDLSVGGGGQRQLLLRHHGLVGYRAGVGVSETSSSPSLR